MLQANKFTKNELCCRYFIKIIWKPRVIFALLDEIRVFFFFQNISQWLLTAVTFNLWDFLNTSSLTHIWKFSNHLLWFFSLELSNSSKNHLMAVYPIFALRNILLLWLAIISNFPESLLHWLQQASASFTYSFCFLNIL